MARGTAPYVSPPPGMNFPEGFPNPPPGIIVTEDPKVVRATRMHRRGSLLYVIAWVAIGTAIVLLSLDLALLFSNTNCLASSSGQGCSSVFNELTDLTLASLGLMGGGFAVRGVAFSMMLHADFLLKSRVPPRMGIVP